MSSVEVKKNEEEEKIRKVVQENLIKYREANNLTQKMVSEALGINASSYRNYETRTIPKQYLLVRLAKIYGITPDKFYEGEYDFEEVKSDGKDFIYGDKYLSELNNYEKLFIMKLRRLNNADKNKVSEYLDEITNNSSSTE